MSDVAVKLWPVASRAACPTHSADLVLRTFSPPPGWSERESRLSKFPLRAHRDLRGAICSWWREISFCVGRPARLPNVGCRRETLACGKQGRLPYTLCSPMLVRARISTLHFSSSWLRGANCCLVARNLFLCRATGSVARCRMSP